MPSFRARAVLAALLLLVAIGEGRSRLEAQAPASAATAVPSIAFEKYSLPNGLEVILSEDHRLPLVAVNVWYHVGPANEEPGRTGFAHLFEHMMFNGSKHVTGDSHFKFVEGAGASDVNGTTSFDRTNYFQTLPANQLELGLWLESDRMGYLLDDLDQAKLSNQQDVVRNERRQSFENRPYGIVDEAVFQQLFPKGHPYYGDIIGSHADIQAAQLGDVQDFFRKYYAPNNASIAIVGDIDKAATKRLVEKYFGPLKAGPPVRKPSVQTPPITAERRAVVTDRVQLPRVTMAWLSPAIYTDGDANADVAASALGGGKSSRLYKALVYDKQIAQDVSAFQYSLMLTSVFILEVTARPGHTAAEIEAAVDEELARFRAGGPEPFEIDRARNGAETQVVRGLERLGGFGGVADRLNDYNHYLGDPGFLQKDLARYQQVTPATVKAFAQQLTQTSRVVVHGVPGTQNLGPEVPKGTAAATASGGEAVNADEAWRATPPKAGPTRALAVPVPRSFRLANGFTVLINDRPGVPIVSASLVLKTGSGANPVAKPGLANFTAAMIDEGTATRSALDIANEAAQLGGTLRTASTVDSIQASVTSLTRTFPQMLALLADVVRHPSFPPEEVERQRASRLAQIVQQRDNANVIASAVAAAALYGTTHPYGFAEIGTDASNKAIGVEDLRTFWAKNFVPNNAALVVSGRISESELRPLVEKAFADWPRGTPQSTEAAAPDSTRARIVLVDKPGASQSQLRAVSMAAPRVTPDYEAMRILNDAFGGLFSSRVNLNLREEHGYTYGANSQFVFRRAPGFFVVAAGVRTDVTAPAMSEVMKELTRTSTDGITDDELTLAMDAIVRSLPSEFETSGSASNTTANLFLYDLPLDYYTRAQARFSAVTAAQVSAAAKKYFAPDRTLFVVVGDRAKIGADLEKLNLGTIELWTPDATRAASPASR
ncbi:MAG TPA: pitrilysin family protein [Vicinamibacterales bacterium]|nr:pitrilysin family protein [Vicinamibacterales bacterium]